MAKAVTRDHHLLSRSLKTTSSEIAMSDGTNDIFSFNVAEPALKIMDDDDTGDYFSIAVGASGATTITTVDDHVVFEAAHLTLDTGGDIRLDPSTGIVNYNFGGNTLITFDMDSIRHRFYAAANQNDYLELNVGAEGATTISTVDADTAVAHLTLDIDGVINLDAVCANDSGINFKSEGTTFGFFSEHHVGAYFTLYGRVAAGLDLNITTDDYLEIKVEEHGATTISTIDNAAANAHLILDADGDITLKPAGNEVWINDGSNDIIELNPAFCRFTIKDDAQTTNYLQIVVGDHGETSLFTIDHDAAIAHLNMQIDGHVEFQTCAVGFDLQTVGGDTNVTVDFRLGNKVLLTFADGNISSMNTIFPAVSGNFVILLKQDATGSRTLTNYKAFDSAVTTASGSASFKFAGGSNPTLTTDADHVDIISIFWDADNEIAYAVPTLDFQF